MNLVIDLVDEYGQSVMKDVAILNNNGSGGILTHDLLDSNQIRQTLLDLNTHGHKDLRAYGIYNWTSIHMDTRILEHTESILDLHTHVYKDLRAYGIYNWTSTYIYTRILEHTESIIGP